jgi:hypothetical protein
MRLARRKDEINQTLRLGLTLLNHQTRIAPTTTTNKIISSSWCHCIGNRTNCVQDVRQLATCLFFIIEWHTSEPRGDSVQRFY